MDEEEEEEEEEEEVGCVVRCARPASTCTREGVGREGWGMRGVEKSECCGCRASGNQALAQTLTCAASRCEACGAQRAQRSPNSQSHSWSGATPMAASAQITVARSRGAACAPHRQVAWRC